MPPKDYPQGGPLADAIEHSPGLDGTYLTPALHALWPSPTQPRKRFDQVKLDELAASVKTAGVHTPILIRQLPQKYLPDTAGMSPRPSFEIIAGERRYRASQLAGKTTIPALLRTLTDAQVLEIQLTENAQRDDLTALEEAEALARLLEGAGIPKEAIGERIGKSRSHVYGRLKLLDLSTVPRKALADGVIDASKALLIARIPDEVLQGKALADITRADHAGEVMSERKAKAHIRATYMLDLARAKFSITDSALLDGAGPCTECPKRTGHAPLLFDDVASADVCTDPGCYQRKDQAHAEALVEQAQAKGQTVIAGREAAELATGGYNSRFKGYKRLDVADDSPTDQPLRKLIGPQMEAEGIHPTMIEDPRKAGQLVAALPNEVVLRLLKAVEGQAQAARSVSKEVRQFAAEKAEKAQAKAAAQYEQAWRDGLVARTWAKLQATGAQAFTDDVHRHLLPGAIGSLSAADAEAVAELLGLGKVGAHHALVEYAQTTERPDLLQLLLIMQRDAGANACSYRSGERVQNAGLMLVAGIVFGDGLVVQTRDAQADATARHLPSSTPAPAHGVRYRCPSTGSTWTGRGKKPRWVEVALEDGRTLGEFSTGDVPPAPAAPAAASRVAKGQKVTGPAARARDVPPPKRKATAQETMQGIAAAMQSAEASALADARPDSEPNAAELGGVGTDTGSANALQGIDASALADAPAADPALLQQATALVRREGKVNLRMLKATLCIGQAKAVELLDAMERAGTISACTERGARKVLAA